MFRSPQSFIYLFMTSSSDLLEELQCIWMNRPTWSSVRQKQIKPNEVLHPRVREEWSEEDPRCTVFYLLLEGHRVSQECPRLPPGPYDFGVRRFTILVLSQGPDQVPVTVGGNDDRRSGRGTMDLWQVTRVGPEGTRITRESRYR